jgi:hypothetical protein
MLSNPENRTDKNMNFTIRNNYNGKWLIGKNCDYTGKLNEELVDCSLAHLRAVAKYMVKNHGSSASEIAVVAQTRWEIAQSARRRRLRRQEAIRDINEAIDAGYLPSISQLRKAGKM